jgi:hypothetical protein
MVTLKPTRLRVVLAAMLGCGLLAGGLYWRAQAQESAAPDAEKVLEAQEQFATPMKERVATISFLNKRESSVRDFQMKPGDMLRVSEDVVVRLSACEKSAPWEAEPNTGAFLQVDVRQEGSFKRVFSGWVYKESPSLNAVEHPLYDVWLKDCTMTWKEPVVKEAPVAVQVSAGNASGAEASAGNDTSGKQDTQ